MNKPANITPVDIQSPPIPARINDRGEIERIRPSALKPRPKGAGPAANRPAVIEPVQPAPAGSANLSGLRPRPPWIGIASFVALVFLPLAIAAWYLFDRAADRYASRAAFSVRSNDSAAPVEFLGAITQIGGGSTLADGQVLYDFIRSQQIVRQIGARMDLVAVFRRVPEDILFSVGKNPPIEDLRDHWQRMVDVALDPASGLLTVEARAFTPDDARAITGAILDASAALVNKLSEEARKDAVRATRREVAEAEAHLRTIRRRLRAFRNKEQEVDPTLNAQAALGLVAKLEEERARTQVRLNELAAILDRSAPRVRKLRRRITMLDGQIAKARTRLGSGRRSGKGSKRTLSAVVGDYEELVVDREFAAKAYTAALAAYQQALAEARRKQRHLAVHIRPTLSEEAEYPDRWLLLAAVFLLAAALWSIAGLIIGNIRERR